jgi:hypothetical protein
MDDQQEEQPMIGKTLNYISHHAIAILALVCSLLALAGASYAATQLSKNSVGTAQLKQGAVTPAKLSGTQFGGYVRAYAVVCATGKLVFSSPQAKLTNWGDSSTGGPSFGTISWKSTAPSRRCAAFATAQNGSPTPITAVVERNLPGVTGTHVAVRFDGAVSVAVEVVC